MRIHHHLCPVVVKRKMYFACVAPLCICYFTNVAQNNTNCKHYFNYFPQCFQALSKFFAKSLFLLCSFSRVFFLFSLVIAPSSLQSIAVCSSKILNKIKHIGENQE